MAALLVYGLMGFATQPAVSQTVASRTLLCTRNRKEIESELISVERGTEHTTTKIGVHLQVKILGITAYRFDQDSIETWASSRLEELRSDTSDNGKHHALQVRRRGTTLQIVADGTSSTIGPESLPASLWYERHAETATLIHNVGGHLLLECNRLQTTPAASVLQTR